MIKIVNPIKNNDCSSNIKDFEVPKFSKAAGAEKIYERDGYIILRVKRGYIVYNTRKRFENGHTHIQSFEMAKTIIDNNIRKKRPKTNSIYLIESHIRVTKDSKYKQIGNAVPVKLAEAIATEVYKILTVENLTPLLNMENPEAEVRADRRITNTVINGKAFEYATLIEIYNGLPNNGWKIEVIQDKNFQNIQPPS